MKYIFLILILIGCYSQAQDKLKIEYQVKFNDQYDRGRQDRMHKGYLFIDNSRSRYYTIQETKYVPKNENDIMIMPDTGNQVFINSEQGMLISEELNMKGNTYFVTDSLYPMKWEVSDEVKKIDSISCIKAESFFRGRKYIAWFTPDIPLSFGPWKMGGLPGLIVDLHDKDENLVIRLTGIARSSQSFIMPDEIKYSMEDHVAEIRKLIKRLKSNSRAGSSGDCLTCQQQSVIQFFTWEKFPE